MATLSLEAVCFHYGSPYSPVFDELTLHLDTCWRAGMVGRNGRGKTTLLQLIRGALEPQRGRMSVPVETRDFPRSPDTPGVTCLEVIRASIAPYTGWERRMEELLALGDEPSLAEYGETLLEYERLGGYTIDQRIEDECARLGLDASLLGRSFESLSGGEQTRALVSGLFLGAEGYPLIDEPTNHLDAEGRARLGDYLASQAGFLLVSHDRALLDRAADHIVAIEPQGVRVLQGGFTTWQSERAHDERRADRHREKLTREIGSLEKAARKRRTWADRREKTKNTGTADRGYEGHRAAKLMKRALGVEKRIAGKLDERRGQVIHAEKQRVLKLTPAEKPPRVLLEAEGLEVSIEGRPLVQGLALRIVPGDRIAIEGPNGCGKTLLLDTLLGERAPSAGRVHRPAPLRWLRAHQHPLWCRGRLALHLESAGFDAARFRTVLAAFGVVGEIFDRPLETFSEGERKKVDLCRSFVEPAHLLVWDEPLNYVDIASREQIEAVVLECQPTLLFVEHDRWFVDRIATRRIKLGA